MASPDGVSRVVQHRDFYLRGGDMTVRVENHIYRIHSFFFYRESPFFRRILGDSDAGEERGSTDQNAYALDDVKSEDFARFLWVFYNPKYSVYDAPLETWLKIIQLADRWTFDNIKELSVRELEKIEIDPVEKIAVYQENKISRLYLVPSYIAVCKQDQPLTLPEANRLGMETVIRLAEARERLRQQVFGRGIRSPTSEDFDDATVETLVREIFSLGPQRSAPAPTTPTLTSTPVTTSINGTSHSAVRADPTPPANPPRANGAPPARANGAWATEHRGSSLDSLSTFASASAPAPASTIPPPAGSGSNTSGRTNGSNTTNGHAGNATSANGTANTTNGRTTNTSTSASTSSSATGSKVSGSGLNRVNFPNTTFRQAKEQLKGGTSDGGGK